MKNTNVQTVCKFLGLSYSKEFYKYCFQLYTELDNHSNLQSLLYNAFLCRLTESYTDNSQTELLQKKISLLDKIFNDYQICLDLILPTKITDRSLQSPHSTSPVPSHKRQRLVTFCSEHNEKEPALNAPFFKTKSGVELSKEEFIETIRQCYHPSNQ